MKRFIAIVISMIIFTSYISNASIEVKASSVAVATGAYITGEAIFSLLCTAFIACGIINTVDRTTDIWIDLPEEEKEEYIQYVIEQYEILCDELVSVGTIEDYEYNSAWLILADANTGTIEGDCQYLADKINEARAQGLDLRGLPIDFGSLSTITKSEVAWYDESSKTLVASPTLFDGLTSDINATINKYAVTAQNKKLANGTSINYGEAEAAISAFGKSVSLTDSEFYILYDSVLNRYLYFPEGYYYAHSSYGFTIRNPKLASYKAYDFESGVVSSISGLTSSFYLYGTRYSLVAWRGLEGYSDNISDAAIDVSGWIDSTGADLDYLYEDIKQDAAKVDNTPYIDEMVFVPPVDNVIDKTTDMVIGLDGTLTDEKEKVLIDELVTDISTVTGEQVDEKVKEDLKLDLYNPGANTSSGLISKFPFCIPADLINAIRMLAAEPEAPRIEIPIVNERLGIDESIAVDFSKFDSIAQVFRVCEVFGFVIFLIMKTRGIIKG